jgi:hypothetical protein
MMDGAEAPRPTFILKIRSLRGDDIRRLRALLKVLLRAHQWRCISVEQERAPAPSITESYEVRR